MFFKATSRQNQIPNFLYDNTTAYSSTTIVVGELAVVD